MGAVAIIADAGGVYNIRWIEVTAQLPALPVSAQAMTLLFTEKGDDWSLVACMRTHSTAKGRCATAQILFPEGQNSYIWFASLYS